MLQICKLHNNFIKSTALIFYKICISIYFLIDKDVAMTGESKAGFKN